MNIKFSIENNFMKNIQKRTTISFAPDLHRALQVKAAETGRSVSKLVNRAVRLFLAENAEDLAAFADRRHEPDLPFEDVLKNLKQRRKI